MGPTKTIPPTEERRAAGKPVGPEQTRRRYLCLRLPLLRKWLFRPPRQAITPSRTGCPQKQQHQRHCLHLGNSGRKVPAPTNPQTDNALTSSFSAIRALADILGMILPAGHCGDDPATPFPVNPGFIRLRQNRFRLTRLAALPRRGSRFSADNREQ